MPKLHNLFCLLQKWILTLKWHTSKGITIYQTYLVFQYHYISNYVTCNMHHLAPPTFRALSSNLQINSKLLTSFHDYV